MNLNLTSPPHPIPPKTQPALTSRRCNLLLLLPLLLWGCPGDKQNIDIPFVNREPATNDSRPQTSGTFSLSSRMPEGADFAVLTVAPVAECQIIGDPLAPNGYSASGPCVAHTSAQQAYSIGPVPADLRTNFAGQVANAHVVPGAFKMTLSYYPADSTSIGIFAQTAVLSTDYCQGEVLFPVAAGNNQLSFQVCQPDGGGIIQVNATGHKPKQEDGAASGESGSQSNTGQNPGNPAAGNGGAGDDSEGEGEGEGNRDASQATSPIAVVKETDYHQVRLQRFTANGQPGDPNTAEPTHLRATIAGDFSDTLCGAKAAATTSNTTVTVNTLRDTNSPASADNLVNPEGLIFSVVPYNGGYIWQSQSPVTTADLPDGNALVPLCKLSKYTEMGVQVLYSKTNACGAAAGSHQDPAANFQALKNDLLNNRIVTAIMAYDATIDPEPTGIGAGNFNPHASFGESYDGNRKWAIHSASPTEAATAYRATLTSYDLNIDLTFYRWVAPLPASDHEHYWLQCLPQ